MHHYHARDQRFPSDHHVDRISDDQITDRVKHELKKSRPVHVRADKSVTYGVVRKVLEKIHDAGAQNVGMGTEEQK